MHEAHPRCPGCKKALYKALKKGSKVKPSDPFAFCRNSSCGLHGRDLSKGSAPEALAVRHGSKTKRWARPSPRDGGQEFRSKAAEQAEEKKAEPVPPPSVLEETRRRLRNFVDLIGFPKNSVINGLFLALLCQELEEDEAARVLAKKHGLEAVFGISFEKP